MEELTSWRIYRTNKQTEDLFFVMKNITAKSKEEALEKFKKTDFFRKHSKGHVYNAFSELEYYRSIIY